VGADAPRTHVVERCGSGAGHAAVRGGRAVGKQTEIWIRKQPVVAVAAAPRRIAG